MQFLRLLLTWRNWSSLPLVVLQDVWLLAVLRVFVTLLLWLNTKPVYTGSRRQGSLLSGVGLGPPQPPNHEQVRADVKSCGYEPPCNGTAATCAYNSSLPQSFEALQ